MQQAKAKLSDVLLWCGVTRGTGETAGGHSSRSDNAMRRMILGSGSRDSRWYQCATSPPPEPRAFPGPRRDLVWRPCPTRPVLPPSTARLRPVNRWQLQSHRISKLSSFQTGDLEGNWELAGRCIFCVVHFLSPAFFTFSALCPSTYTTLSLLSVFFHQAVQCRVG